MDLLWGILLLVSAGAAAEGGSKVTAALGTNTTLSCSLNDSVIRWYMEIHQNIRVCIVQVIPGLDEDNRDFCVHGPEGKYVTEGNKLSIVGIRADDYRRYFCARREGGQLTFKDTFQVVPDEPIQAPKPTNQSDLECPGTTWTPVLGVLCSLVLNVLLLVTSEGPSCLLEQLDGSKRQNSPENLSAVAGLAGLVVKRKRCRCRSPSPWSREDPESLEAPVPKPSEPIDGRHQKHAAADTELSLFQYETIPLSSHTPAASAPPAECLYSTVQHPQPFPPPGDAPQGPKFR